MGLNPTHNSQKTTMGPTLFVGKRVIYVKVMHFQSQSNRLIKFTRPNKSRKKDSKMVRSPLTTPTMVVGLPKVKFINYCL